MIKIPTLNQLRKNSDDFNNSHEIINLLIAQIKKYDNELDSIQTFNEKISLNVIYTFTDLIDVSYVINLGNEFAKSGWCVRTYKKELNTLGNHFMYAFEVFSKNVIFNPNLPDTLDHRWSIHKEFHPSKNYIHTSTN